MNMYTNDLDIHKNKSIKNMYVYLKNVKMKCNKYVLNETKRLCVYFFKSARKAGCFLFYVKKTITDKNNK